MSPAELIDHTLMVNIDWSRHNQIWSNKHA
jgi:hypothetical protein